MPASAVIICAGAILSTNSASFSVYGGHLTIRPCASLPEASSPHEPAFVCGVGPAPKAPRETVDAPSALFVVSVLYLHISTARAFKLVKPLHISSVNGHPNAIRSCTSASRRVHAHRSDRSAPRILFMRLARFNAFKPPLFRAYLHAFGARQETPAVVHRICARPCLSPSRNE